MDVHVLKIGVYKFNFLNFYISEITVFSLKLAQFSSNKWSLMRLESYMCLLSYVVFKRIWMRAWFKWDTVQMVKWPVLPDIGMSVTYYLAHQLLDIGATQQHIWLD